NKPACAMTGLQPIFKRAPLRHRRSLHNEKRPPPEGVGRTSKSLALSPLARSAADCTREKKALRSFLLTVRCAPACRAPEDILLDTHGHSAPVTIHACTSAPASAWVPGAGARPLPGSQP